MKKRLAACLIVLALCVCLLPAALADGSFVLSYTQDKLTAAGGEPVTITVSGVPEGAQDVRYTWYHAIETPSGFSAFGGDILNKPSISVTSGGACVAYYYCAVTCTVNGTAYESVTVDPVKVVFSADPRVHLSYIVLTGLETPAEGCAPDVTLDDIPGVDMSQFRVDVKWNTTDRVFRGDKIYNATVTITITGKGYVFDVATVMLDGQYVNMLSREPDRIVFETMFADTLDASDRPVTGFTLSYSPSRVCILPGERAQLGVLPDFTEEERESYYLVWFFRRSDETEWVPAGLHEGDASWLRLDEVGVYYCKCLVFRTGGSVVFEQADLEADDDCVTVFVDEDGCAFDDVTKDDWFFDNVTAAFNEGLIDGKSATTFCPRDSIKVCEVIKLAAAMHQREALGRVTLTDGSDVWYSSWMKYALDNALIETDMTADAETPCSRALCVDIFRSALSEGYYAEVKQVPDGAVPDVKAGDPYAEEIYTFYRAGILDGALEDGSFLPENSISRAEVSAIMARLIFPWQRIWQ